MYFSGTGNVFPPARGVGLEDHCDDDRWSHLVSTRNQHLVERHLLCLLVEILPIHLEVLLLKSSLLTVGSRLRVGSRNS